MQVTKRSIEYLHMEPTDLRDVISENALNVRSEEQLFDALVRWIDYDNVSRSQYISELIRHVRLGLLSLSYFVEVVANNPYVVGSGGKCDSHIQVILGR